MWFLGVYEPTSTIDEAKCQDSQDRSANTEKGGVTGSTGIIVVAVIATTQRYRSIKTWYSPYIEPAAITSS